MTLHIAVETEILVGADAMAQGMLPVQTEADVAQRRVASHIEGACLTAFVLILDKVPTVVVMGYEREMAKHQRRVERAVEEGEGVEVVVAVVEHSVQSDVGGELQPVGNGLPLHILRSPEHTDAPLIFAPSHEVVALLFGAGHVGVDEVAQGSGSFGEEPWRLVGKTEPVLPELLAVQVGVAHVDIQFVLPHSHTSTILQPGLPCVAKSVVGHTPFAHRQRERRGLCSQLLPAAPPNRRCYHPLLQRHRWQQPQDHVAFPHADPHVARVYCAQAHSC